MRELRIESNEHGQRLDRFIGKYLDQAPRSFIFRMIRKKNIELNRKKAKPETIIKEGDRVQLFLAEDTIEKFRSQMVINPSQLELDIVYEDKNILLINKPSGILSHSSDNSDEENIVDAMIKYLIKKGDYIPEEEYTFIPSICNRLDRNTSGIIIAAKNYQALKEINDKIKDRSIRRYYKTLVAGQLGEDQKLVDSMEKNHEKNKVYLVDEGKEMETNIKILETTRDYSLLEVEIITGRTHQIRVHLASIDHPIIGDYKYGNRQVNDGFKRKYGLEDQLLHSYKIEFNNLQSELEYLNQKTFTSQTGGIFKRIEEEIFKED